MSDQEDPIRRIVELNAAEELLSHQLSELCRYIIRATISQDYYQANRHHAAETLKHLAGRILAESDPVSCTKVINEVVDNLIPQDVEDERKEGLMRVAEAGTIFHLEMSSTDNAARGRQSKQRDGLMHAIRHYNEVSKLPRSKL